MTSTRELRLVFDQFPCPEGARFIEAEDANGKSVTAGEWRKRLDGYVELVVRELPAVPGTVVPRTGDAK